MQIMIMTYFKDKMGGRCDDNCSMTTSDLFFTFEGRVHIPVLHAYPLHWTWYIVSKIGKKYETKSLYPCTQNGSRNLLR